MRLHAPTAQRRSGCLGLLLTVTGPLLAYFLLKVCNLSLVLALSFVKLRLKFRKQCLVLLHVRKMLLVLNLVRLDFKQGLFVVLSLLVELSPTLGKFDLKCLGPALLLEEALLT